MSVAKREKQFEAKANLHGEKGLVNAGIFCTRIYSAQG